MRTINFGLAVLMLFSLMLTGCESIPYAREQNLIDNWGQSFQAIKTNHVINPDAGMDEASVEGMDGIAAEKAINKYYKTFDEKPPAQVTNISISGIGGGK